ncbi:MAG TPA: hypothetical protein VFA45_13655 [Actinomycetes bacterium]|jgi:hypothetical protein|nr:hypothetical protein [Actinomycetes bacterium]
MEPHRDLAPLVGDALLGHERILEVELVGSRAAGRATPLSDWDFRVHVEAGAFAAVAADLPGLVSVLAPLAGQWDRLSSHQCYMLMLDGPVKVDLLFAEPHRPEPPWMASPRTLRGIDAHLWDWVLWLLAKQHAGRDELVGAELAKMHEYLLAPMGVGQAPASVSAAVAAYRAARNRLEARFGVRVPRRLEAAVSPMVAAG